MLSIGRRTDGGYPVYLTVDRRRGRSLLGYVWSEASADLYTGAQLRVWRMGAERTRTYRTRKAAVTALYGAVGM